MLYSLNPRGFDVKTAALFHVLYKAVFILTPLFTAIWLKKNQEMQHATCQKQH